jgi:hypothetical protein
MVSSAGIIENRLPRIRDLRRMMFIAASLHPGLSRPFRVGRSVKIACLAPLVALR